MSEKTTVAFRVDESVKQEWEEAAEDPEYDSLSHLIRLAVQREITDTVATETDVRAGLGNDGEILGSLNRLEKTVQEIHEEIGAVSRETESEELYDLEQVLIEILPSYDVEEPDSELIRPKVDGLTPEKAASRIGAEEEVVSQALNRLYDNLGQIRRTDWESDDQPEYWRVE
jgi:hypothetical protein